MKRRKSKNKNNKNKNKRKVSNSKTDDEIALLENNRTFFVNKLELALKERWNSRESMVVPSPRPSNPITGTVYSGNNSWALAQRFSELCAKDDSGREILDAKLSYPFFITFAQKTALGGHLTKGQKACSVKFVKPMYEEEEDVVGGRFYTLPSWFNVFCILQCKPEEKFVEVVTKLVGDHKLKHDRAVARYYLGEELFEGVPSLCALALREVVARGKEFGDSLKGLPQDIKDKLWPHMDPSWLTDIVNKIEGNLDFDVEIVHDKPTPSMEVDCRFNEYHPSQDTRKGPVHMLPKAAFAFASNYACHMLYAYLVKIQNTVSLRIELKSKRVKKRERVVILEMALLNVCMSLELGYCVVVAGVLLKTQSMPIERFGELRGLSNVLSKRFLEYHTPTYM